MSEESEKKEPLTEKVGASEKASEKVSEQASEQKEKKTRKVSLLHTALERIRVAARAKAERRATKAETRKKDESAVKTVKITPKHSDEKQVKKTYSIKARGKKHLPKRGKSATAQYGNLSAWIDLQCKRLARWISYSWLGNLLTAYTKEEAIILAPFTRVRRAASALPAADRQLASVTEQVFQVSVLKRMRYALLTCPSGYYTDALLVYSAFSILSNYVEILLKSFLALTDAGQWLSCAVDALNEFLHTPVFIVNVALFFLFFFFGLFFRQYSLHQIKQKSMILSGIFSGLFGMKGELTENLKRRFGAAVEDAEKGNNLKAFLLLIGFALGVLSALVSPFIFLLCIGVLLLGSIIIRNPESGLIVSLMVLPFVVVLGDFSSIYLAESIQPTLGGVVQALGYPVCVLLLLMLFTAFSYFLKLLRKKRRISFGLIDCAVSLVAIGILVYSVFPYPTLSSVVEGLLAFALLGVYFFASNFLKTEVWMKRALIALQFSVAVTLGAGIYIYFFGVPKLGWFPSEQMTGEAGVISSFFGSDSALGAFLVMMLPLSAVCVLVGHTVWLRILGFISIMEGVTVAALLSDATASLCLVWMMLSATLLVSYRMLYVTPLGLLSGVAVYRLIPPAHGSFTELLTETFGKGLYLWDAFLTALQGTDASLWGIGYGLLRYREVYGTGVLIPEESFAMRYFLTMGIPGVILAVLLTVLLVQMALEEIRASAHGFSRLGVIGALTSVTAVLLCGVFTPIFTSPRIFFLFWLTVGMTVAFCRVSKGIRAEEARVNYEVPSERNATVTVY